MNDALLPLLSFAGIASLTAAVLFGLRDLFGRAAPPPITIGRLPVRRQDEPSSWLERYDRWLARTLYLSGLSLSPFAATLLQLLVALTAGGLAFLTTESVALTALAGGIGFFAVLGGIVWAMQRRTAKFLEQFPQGLDLLARAVRAGQSLEQGIALVGEASRAPLSIEFRRCAAQLELGLSAAATMQSLSHRMDLLDVQIFAGALTVHREVGGNLAVTLERLAHVIRERRDFKRQLKSVTGAGRFSALFIATLGPLLFAYLFLFQPEYGRSLWEDPTGRMMLVYAAVSQGIGLFWISRLLKTDM